jgi:hypothetical protein
MREKDAKPGARGDGGRIGHHFSGNILPAKSG